MYLSCEVSTAQEVLSNLRGFESLFTDCENSEQEDRIVMRVSELLNTCAFEFGLCEIYARKAMRAEAAGFKTEIRHLAALTETHQKNGLSALATAIAAAEVLSEPMKVPSARARNVLEGEAERLNRDIITYLAGSELKPSDIGKVQKTLVTTLSACREAETPGSIIYARLRELQEVRLRDDRGNVDNLPVWKIAIIAVYAGLTIWKVWRCIIRNRCSRAERAAIETASAIAGISLKFC